MSLDRKNLPNRRGRLGSDSWEGLIPVRLVVIDSGPSDVVEEWTKRTKVETGMW